MRRGIAFTARKLERLLVERARPRLLATAKRLDALALELADPLLGAHSPSQ